MVVSSLVSIVDDDDSVRESLPGLLKRFGHVVRAFASAEAFLASDCVGQTQCLILDVVLPGLSGPALQQELQRRGSDIPVIYITADENEALRQRLLGRGAIDCLFKPFTDQALRDALAKALAP